MDLEVILLQFALGIVSFGANLLSACAGGGAGLVQLPALILFEGGFAEEKSLLIVESSSLKNQ